ncbi:MAG: sugar ABC transporter permease [Lachnospiraceae bacterium]|jgi:raffinose/stachyose/melibiose transport system permease protein|nr:sugar ABC transporter permease [Lachnospiraceae bacterium]
MHNKNKYLTVFLFLLPALALFIGVLVYPIIASIHHSMYEYRTFTDPGEFVGFKNYIDLFNSQYDFGHAIINALILAALSVFIQLPLSLGLALMLGKGIKGERFYLSVYFMPVLISAVVIGMLWEKIYNPIYGLLVKSFEAMNMSSVLPPEGLLGNPKTALMAVFLPTIWQYVGYHMLLMYAGVKGVSPELREAAMLDGATSGQVDRYVVIPCIKPIIKVSIIFAITGSLKSYDLIKVFAKDAYNCSYKVPSLLLVRYAFNNAGGIASAIAVLMIIMCFGFAILVNWMFKERNPYGAK